MKVPKLVPVVRLTKMAFIGSDCGFNPPCPFTATSKSSAKRTLLDAKPFSNDC